MAEKCFFCGEPATLLCDFGLGLVIGGEHEGSKVCTMQAMLAQSTTCDAPFCRKCGKAVGHICGQNLHDTIDYCPLHAGSTERGGLMTAEELAKKRRSIHASYRRARIREDMTLREQIDYWRERALAAEESTVERLPHE